MIGRYAKGIVAAVGALVTIALPHLGDAFTACGEQVTQAASAILTAWAVYLVPNRPS